jgi:hypothetical protein
VQSRKNSGKPAENDRIFPYNEKSVGASHTRAKRQLSEEMPSIKDLRFNDYRYHAVCCFLENDHPPHEVANATGMDIGRVDEIHKSLTIGVA